MPDLTPDEVLRRILDDDRKPPAVHFSHYNITNAQKDLARQLLACREALKPLASAWEDYSSGEIVLGELFEDAVEAAKACLPEHREEGA